MRRMDAGVLRLVFIEGLLLARSRHFMGTSALDAFVVITAVNKVSKVLACGLRLLYLGPLTGGRAPSYARSAYKSFLPDLYSECRRPFATHSH